MTSDRYVATKDFDAALLHLAGTGKQREETGFANSIRAN
jgi:hypothetical protein